MKDRVTETFDAAYRGYTANQDLAQILSDHVYEIFSIKRPTSRQALVSQKRKNIYLSLPQIERSGKMSDYIATNYDNLLQDETSHVMPNIHSLDDNEEEADMSAHWNEDDNGTIVHESDWMFIGYRENKNGTLAKYVVQQENFLLVVDEYGPKSLRMDTMKIISGKEWLKQKTGGV